LRLLSLGIFGRCARARYELATSECGPS
jgi:hypothetical protein